MTQPAAVSGRVDEEAFVSLKDEIAAYVANEGEEWTRRIEEERAVPPGLRDELQARGYLSIAAPEEYGGRGIPFSRWLELLELFSMSHASLRMIVRSTATASSPSRSPSRPPAPAPTCAAPCAARATRTSSAARSTSSPSA
jgi:alkylation response protein AidB-like acyl-CoA dehydrogenase